MVRTCHSIALELRGWCQQSASRVERKTHGLAQILANDKRKRGYGDVVLNSRPASLPATTSLERKCCGRSKKHIEQTTQATRRRRFFMWPSTLTGTFIFGTEHVFLAATPGNQRRSISTQL